MVLAQMFPPWELLLTNSAFLALAFLTIVFFFVLIGYIVHQWFKHLQFKEALHIVKNRDAQKEQEGVYIVVNQREKEGNSYEGYSGYHSQKGEKIQYVYKERQ